MIGTLADLCCDSYVLLWILFVACGWFGCVCAVGLFFGLNDLHLNAGLCFSVCWIFCLL